MISDNCNYRWCSSIGGNASVRVGQVSYYPLPVPLPKIPILLPDSIWHGFKYLRILMYIDKPHMGSDTVLTLLHLQIMLILTAD